MGSPQSHLCLIRQATYTMSEAWPRLKVCQVWRRRRFGAIGPPGNSTSNPFPPCSIIWPREKNQKRVEGSASLHRVCRL